MNVLRKEGEDFGTMSFGCQWSQDVPGTRRAAGFSCRNETVKLVITVDHHFCSFDDR